MNPEGMEREADGEVVEGEVCAPPKPPAAPLAEVRQMGSGSENVEMIRPQQAAS